MKTSLLLEYKYPYGLINALWAAKDRYGYLPDKIIVATQEQTHHTSKVVQMLRAWQRGHGIQECVEVLALPSEPAAMKRQLRDTLVQEHAAGQVAVDVTSGRTVPKLALYRAALEAEPSHVFYLDVDAYDYRPEAYPLVPRRIQRCHDLDLEEIRNA